MKTASILSTLTKSFNISKHKKTPVVFKHSKFYGNQWMLEDDSIKFSGDGEVEPETLVSALKCKEKPSIEENKFYCGRTSFALSSVSDTFSPPLFSPYCLGTLSLNEIHKIQDAFSFISSEAGKYSLNNLCFAKGFVYATNGKVAYRSSISILPKNPVILDAKALKVALDIMETFKDVKVYDISESNYCKNMFWEGAYLFEASKYGVTVSVFVPFVDGLFPEVDAVIPKTEEIKMNIIGVKDLKKAVGGFPKGFSPTKVEFQNDKIQFTTIESQIEYKAIVPLCPPICEQEFSLKHGIDSQFLKKIGAISHSASFAFGQNKNVAFIFDNHFWGTIIVVMAVKLKQEI